MLPLFNLERRQVHRKRRHPLQAQVFLVVPGPVPVLSLDRRPQPVPVLSLDRLLLPVPVLSLDRPLDSVQLLRSIQLSLLEGLP